MNTATKLSIPVNESPQLPDENERGNERLAWVAVWVAALGYFIDVFDLWLFSNFRVASLTSLGFSPKEVTEIGAWLINWQQGGLLLGGFIWGVMGDKRGRASVMFGSILLYSVANILNAFVTSAEQYAVLRFITGIGLAGEIGAGITLISEILPSHRRGYGTTLVTALGVSGAIFAALAGKYLDWRTAYLVGGVLGLMLLFLRFMVHESGMFAHMSNSDPSIKKGSLRLLFGSWERVARFFSCILLGVPIYLCYGILVTFSPEIAQSIGITEPLKVADVMFLGSIGLTVGDVFAGLLSQKMQSRKRPILIFAVLSAACSMFIATGVPQNALQYSIICGVMGLFCGSWACLITMSAEQFGTNLRATVTTSVPNLIRGSAIILTTSFIWLKNTYSMPISIWVLSAGIYVLLAIGMFFLKDTFHRDLNFYER